MRGYMGEVFWRQEMYGDQCGVVYIQTTSESNAASSHLPVPYPDVPLWNIFFVPGAFDDAPPSQFSEYAFLGIFLGRVGDVYLRQAAQCGMGNMQFFLEFCLGWTCVYHGLAGYNLQFHIIDGFHHCIDWYWQRPAMLLAGGVYNWLILLDVCDPKDWYRARQVHHNGQRHFEDIRIIGVNDRAGIMLRSRQ